LVSLHVDERGVAVLEDVAVRFSCVVLEEGLEEVGDNGFVSIFIVDEDESISLTITVLNDATTSSGNNIIAVEGDNANYAFKAYFAVGDATPVLGGKKDVTLSSGAGKGLDATVSDDFVGTVTLNLGSTFCAAALKLCVELEVGEGASYKDADDTNNKACMTFDKTCFPGKYH